MSPRLAGVLPERVGGALPAGRRAEAAKTNIYYQDSGMDDNHWRKILAAGKARRRKHPRSPDTSGGLGSNTATGQMGRNPLCGSAI